ncbi:MAG TPA: sigma-54-dependent Fis family transcriptional regulator [Ramlibacter sp.]|nr:sigma-54-dependent Fis family transcriptional regulator [Ramlibacter sp.]
MTTPPAASPEASRSGISPVHRLEENGHRLIIDEAQQRSRAFGIDTFETPDFSSPGRTALSRALDENRFLLQHAAPAMETLYEQIAQTHSMVLLTSANGMILHSLGDSDFVERASEVALAPGVDWSEKSKGTNAIGTALHEEQPIIVHGAEHYMSANRFLTCSCAPICDPHGQLIGALDVTGDHRSFHQHTMALVRMSAQMIENHMFADIFPKAVRIHFHSRPEFIGTLVEGIVVFSAEGRFLSANRSAQFQLGLSHNGLKVHTFSSLFGIPMSRLFELCAGSAQRLHSLCLHNGVTVACRVKIKSGPVWSLGSVSTMLDEPSPAPALAAPPAREAPAKPRLSSLHYLDTGDPQVAAVIRKLKMVRGRDIPVMILGETGTGKDLMAQAIHGDSNRAERPFVSVNCASIPETLIESELFGYEDGAFTGARKKGAIGKIQQANGGTLFLDEIGDMPKHLQARLLRVLQDRRVSPLGAGREVEVDIAVVCATNRNLKDMIASGEFREDLYYRLNGLVVRLPALRERTDFELVVQRILATVSQGTPPVSVSAEVMALFRSYHWPGNFRQLHNLLRTATVMVDSGGVIERSHLPDDFLDELAQAREPAPDPARTTLPAAIDDAAAAGPDAHSLQGVALSTMALMLRKHHGNVSAAAKALGVSRNTIYRKKDLLPPDVWH